MRASDVIPSFDVDQIRNQFPALDQSVGGERLVYLDNAATTQKPEAVISTVADYYRSFNANVHRGVHTLSQQATDAYEKSRSAVKEFVHAREAREIVFTKGTTDAINLVANGLSDSLKEGDEILLTEMEHHSNIVPWQLTARKTNAVVKFVRVLPNGELDLDHFDELLSERTKIIAVAHTSNSLGTINPIKRIVASSRQVGALVLVDGAQAVQHGKVDLQDLGCDFFCFSSHKMYGPTGVGVLYGKEDILEKLPPYQGGGDMIKTVSTSGVTFAELPYKFEAGTPNIAGVIGLAAAISFLTGVGLKEIESHERNLLRSSTNSLKQIGGVRIVGEADAKAGVVSFLIGNTHPYDVGTILNQQGIAVRTGHHCTMPLMTKLKIPGTVRASFGLYNTEDDIDKLVKGVAIASRILS